MRFAIVIVVFLLIFSSDQFLTERVVGGEETTEEIAQYYKSLLVKIIDRVFSENTKVLKSRYLPNGVDEHFLGVLEHKRWGEREGVFHGDRIILFIHVRLPKGKIAYPLEQYTDVVAVAHYDLVAEVKDGEKKLKEVPKRTLINSDFVNDGNPKGTTWQFIRGDPPKNLKKKLEKAFLKFEVAE